MTAQSYSKFNRIHATIYVDRCCANCIQWCGSNLANIDSKTYAYCPEVGILTNQFYVCLEWSKGG